MVSVDVKHHVYFNKSRWEQEEGGEMLSREPRTETSERSSSQGGGAAKLLRKLDYPLLQSAFLNSLVGYIRTLSLPRWLRSPLLPGSGPWLVECCFMSTETIGLLGTGAQDGHLNFHTAPELCLFRLKLVDVLLYIHRNHRLFRDRSPEQPPRLSQSAPELSIQPLRSFEGWSVWMSHSLFTPPPPPPTFPPHP